MLLPFVRAHKKRLGVAHIHTIDRGNGQGSSRVCTTGLFHWPSHVSSETCALSQGVTKFNSAFSHHQPLHFESTRLPDQCTSRADHFLILLFLLITRRPASRLRPQRKWTQRPERKETEANERRTPGVASQRSFGPPPLAEVKFCEPPCTPNKLMATIAAS